jgi:hypothetical protein
MKDNKSYTEEASGNQLATNWQPSDNQLVPQNNINKNKRTKDKENKGNINKDIDEIPASNRHKYGTYKNVLLSDEEINKLKTEFPCDWEEWIEKVSEYVAIKGKGYSNYLATIRKWARKEKGTGDKSKTTQSLAEIADEISDNLERGIF